MIATLKTCFFFQAEDGIRGGTVTGVQTCALPILVTEVLNRLRARGVTFSPAILQGGSDLLKQEIGYEVARYSFGRIGEFHRRISDDQQVVRALDLARKARTPQELLSLRSEEHTSELQSQFHLVCRLLLE